MRQEWYRELGSEISAFTDPAFSNEVFRQLCHTLIIEECPPQLPPIQDRQFFLYDVIEKILCRGRRPFPDYEIERRIVEVFGPAWEMQEVPHGQHGSIKYVYEEGLVEAYNNFTDFLDHWSGDLSTIPLDPEHDENERRLLRQLVDIFGYRLINCLYPQVNLDSILDFEDAPSFSEQRGDFLISLPNGKVLLIEPGDHDEADQQHLDYRRDEAFNKIGISTLRPRNKEIGSEILASNIRREIRGLNGSAYFEREPSNNEKSLAAQYLFLLPSLVARTEWLLNQSLLRRDLISSGKIFVHFQERDLQVAECAFLSFIGKVERLSKLYGFPFGWPETHVYLQRNPSYASALPNNLRSNLSEYGIHFHEVKDVGVEKLDLSLDLSIKSNILTPPANKPASLRYMVRNSYRRNESFRFSYHTRPRPIVVSMETEGLLETFLQDLFRKYALRPGQFPILLNVLAQKTTIGLLPTSAGKSICYQLAALLTPGTTIVVDPITALMLDQVQGLQELYHIDRVFPWHAASGVKDEDISRLLAGNLMVFISPERLLRPNFRNAMRSLNAADIFVNYAVIDEAHCVSMWGHDFRPSYLSLDRNFKQYCSFQGRIPITVALTGTASQLVLIDLKRELNIEAMDAIVRPKTFDRAELTLNLIKCKAADKNRILTNVLATIADRLGVPNLVEYGWGIVFAYTPRELWDLLGKYVGAAKDHVQTVLQTDEPKRLRFGMYSGSVPHEAPFTRDQWETYKRKTLAAFKSGHVRMLFGNTAISVGIDNEKLNYIVNYKMPQSVEAYYQQCGRAGRGGQPSQCFLIFSDDQPVVTQRWLNGETERMGRRNDDLGIVSYFHYQNFPGKDPDVMGAMSVFRTIFSGENLNDGRVIVPEANDHTERYLSFWLVLGVIDDYEVTGMERTTRYHVRLHPVVERSLADGNEQALQGHLLKSLHAYISRYQPYTREHVEELVAQHPGDIGLSQRIIRSLVDFIYDRIVYQRREAIRTMVKFCNQEDTSPERLRTIIRAYFDESEKFTETLNRMAERTPSPNDVAQILERIEGFDDIEILFWETRRLLDERFRPDWALLNIFTMVYQERTLSDTSRRLLLEALSEMEKDSTLDDNAIRGLLSMPLNFLDREEKETVPTAGSSAVIALLNALYENSGFRYADLIDAITPSAERRNQYRMALAILQMEKIIHVARYQ
jgi:hypothetical protein